MIRFKRKCQAMGGASSVDNGEYSSDGMGDGDREGERERWKREGERESEVEVWV